jgi:hypothetical protein
LLGFRPTSESSHQSFCVRTVIAKPGRDAAAERPAVTAVDDDARSPESRPPIPDISYVQPARRRQKARISAFGLGVPHIHDVRRIGDSDDTGELLFRNLTE